MWKHWHMGLKSWYEAKSVPSIGPLETSMKEVPVFDPCGDPLDSLAVTDDTNLCVYIAVTFSNETADD